MFWWMTATVLRRNDPPAKYTVEGVSSSTTDKIWEEALKAVEEKHLSIDKRQVSFVIVVDAFGVHSNRG